MILPILFGALVGVALGLTGGGGSIFAVPLLIYGLNFDLRRAVAMSLAVVGLTALYGAIIQIRRGRVRWRAGAILGSGGIVAAPFGALIGNALREDIALYVFALLMVVVGYLMLRKPDHSADVPLDWMTCQREPGQPARFTWRCAAKLAGAGVLTGALSGAFGVGGGFLVVPALLIVLGLEMNVAVATSLVAIFLVAASGLVANLTHLQPSDTSSGLAFLLGAGGGMTVGVWLKQHLPAAALKKIFGWSVIATAVFMAVQTYLNGS